MKPSARLEADLERALELGSGLTVVLVEPDPAVGAGPEQGRVLELASRRIDITRRAADRVDHWSGGRLLVALPNTPREHSCAVTRRLLDCVLAAGGPADTSGPALVNMGAASYPEDGNTTEALLAHAEHRLRAAARTGGGCAVCDDSGEAPPPLVLRSFRLVERDAELATARRFLEELPAARRGTLSIIGSAGSGRSRFLGEVRVVALKLGYEIVAVTGEAALHRRAFSALLRARSPLPHELPLEPDALIDTLRRVVDRAGRVGLLISVDRLHQIDRESLHLIAAVAASNTIPVVGLVIVGEVGSEQVPLTTKLGRIETLTLEPLSRDALRAWLGQVLDAEPNAELVDWMHAQTGGWPDQVREALRFLLVGERLRCERDRWLFSPPPAIEPTSFRGRDEEEESPPHNLPVARTSLIGRNREMARAKRLIDEARVLTVAGPDGVGKTHFTLQLAWELLRAVPDGIVHVPVAHLETSAAATDAITEALGSVVGPSAPDPDRGAGLVAVAPLFADRRMVLVLDGLDHRVPWAAELERLLAAVPALRVLAASETPLNYAGERVLELGGLSAESARGGADLNRSEAVHLFGQHAPAPLPGLTPAADDRAAVVRICRLLGGTPLAIELAAAMARVLSPTEIAEDLRRSVDALARERRDLGERARGLRAVLDYSWNLLSEEQKAGARKLAVFQAGFAPETARHVAGISAPALAALRGRALIRRGVGCHYELHGVVHAYFLEKLERVPHEREEAEGRHSEYFARFLTERMSPADGRLEPETRAELAAELPEIMAAWRSALRRDDAATLLRIADPLARFLRGQGREEEADAVLLARETPAPSG